MKKNSFFSCKNLTNVASVFSVLFMVFMFVYSDKSAVDIIAIGAAIKGVFLPIDVSQIVKNTRGREPQVER